MEIWYFEKGDFTSDNGSKVFTLDQANLGKLQPYAQEVTAAFDEYGFEAITDARIENTEDLMRYLKGLETSYTSQEMLPLKQMFMAMDWLSMMK